MMVAVSEHLLEIAKALVRIKDGNVEVLSDPLISSCPLSRSLYGIERESRESVSRVLGHTNIVTTQIYAKITTQKLNSDLTLFGNRLNQSFNNVSMEGQ